jgi:hypothetical protein
MYFVVRDDGNFTPATQSYCSSQRTRYGLTMTVVFDPENKVGQALAGGGKTNDLAVILSHAGSILLNQRFPGDSTIWAKVDEALADAP